MFRKLLPSFVFAFAGVALILVPSAVAAPKVKIAFSSPTNPTHSLSTTAAFTIDHKPSQIKQLTCSVDNGRPVPTPSVSISDASVVEGGLASEPGGDIGVTPLTFTVNLSAASNNLVTVDYATTPLSELPTMAGGTLDFQPGETSKPLTVFVHRDTAVELDKAFLVDLTNAENATIADGQAMGTVVDDDTTPPQVTLSINDVSVNEGNVFQTEFTFTVSLSAVRSNSVTVDYSTADGTAVAPSDYHATSGTLTYAPGETTKQLTVNVVGDTAPERSLST